MAIQKTIYLQNGLTVNDSYIRIDTINGHKGVITISVNSYTSKQDFLDGVSYLEQKIYSFVPDTLPNALEMWTQAYEYLKTLGEFDDAIDILED